GRDSARRRLRAMDCCAAECSSDCPGYAGQWRDGSVGPSSSHDSRVTSRTYGQRLQDGVWSKSASAECAVNGSLQRKKSVENPGDSQACLTVPKRRDGALLRATVQEAFDLLVATLGLP